MSWKRELREGDVDATAGMDQSWTHHLHDSPYTYNKNNWKNEIASSEALREGGVWRFLCNSKYSL